MDKIKASFENQKVYVGLDVHKRSWNAALYLNDQYVRNIHQPPTPKALHHYLTENYPKADYLCAYESGKFGLLDSARVQQAGHRLPGGEPGRHPQHAQGRSVQDRQP